MSITKIFINNIEYPVDLDSDDIINRLLNDTVQLIFSIKKDKENSLGSYKKISIKDTTETCPICLENFKEGLYKRSLNCNHTFHKKCIDKWLFKEESCPICRKNPFVASGASERTE